MSGTIESGTMDILMVTHDRPHYTKQSLGRLLETCDDRMRVRNMFEHFETGNNVIFPGLLF